MRFLFTCIGGPGHLNPLLPISRAVADAGHTVLWATSDGLRGLVDGAGFPFHRLGPAADRTPRARGPLVPPSPELSDWEVRENFARKATRKRLPLVQPLVDDWRPDVVVCDEFDFASTLAAERRGIPHAVVLVTAAGTLIRPDVVGEPLDEIRREHGLPADPDLTAPGRYLALSPFPPSLRAPGTWRHATEHAVRPPMPAGTGPRPARPLVYFTLGTEFGLESGDVFERVLAGLADLPVDVLLTVGRHVDPAEFGPQPPHVRIERYVAQDEVLSRCDVVVSHGGSGTVMGALTHGLPHLVVPLGADQLSNAERCTALGAGLALDAVAATPGEVAEAVSRLLADPSHRRAAERLRAELAALPDADHAADLLVRLARTRQPGTA